MDDIALLGHFKIPLPNYKLIMKVTSCKRHFIVNNFLIEQTILKKLHSELYSK